MDKNKLIKRKKIFPIYIVLGSLAIMGMFMVGGITQQYWLVGICFLSFPIFPVSMFIYYDKKIVRPFKEEIIKKKLIKAIPSIKFEYKPDTTELVDIFRKLCLVPKASSFSFLDEIIDIDYDYVYKSLDLHATHSSGGKNRTTYTDFKGKVYILDDFNLSCEFVLINRMFINRYALNRFFKHNPEYQEITTYNDTFNCNYFLASSDKMAIMDIFNDNLISGIIGMNDIIVGNINIAYYKTKLYILINNSNDQFEDANNVVENYELQKDHLDIVVKVIEKTFARKEVEDEVLHNVWD